MSGNVEFYKELSSQIQFGFSLIRIRITKGPFVDRIKVLTVFVLIIVSCFTLLFHLSATFDGNITNNSLMTFLMLSGVLQLMLKKFSGLTINEVVFEQLMQWIRSLYNEVQDDSEIKRIISTNLQGITNFWKLAYRVVYMATFTTSSAFLLAAMLKGEEGIIFRYPFLPLNFPLSLQLRHVLQCILTYVLSYDIVYCDISIFYIGLQLYGAININYEIINYWNEDIQERPNVIKIIAKKHCDIITSINFFQDVLLWLSFTHFVTSTFILLFLFTLVRTNAAAEMAIIIICFIITELFILCFFGEIIQAKMEQLAETFYLTNWYDLSLEDKKAFLIILGMMQRTYPLKAARLYDINFNSFIQIVKMAISYCALLVTFST
uniref:Odorant receptor n=1 Tax=Lutzomyia longipalpis TaxID=7200 RepID=A0A3F2ZDC9_LUTLO